MAATTILVVDDSPMERFFLTELLTKSGYKVITADNGEEGLQRARQDKPDVILMDVVMPGLNGYQATRMLSKDDTIKHIPVIMCTSRSQETDRVWGLRQGAVAYLVKPIQPELLLAKIKSVGNRN